MSTLFNDLQAALDSRLATLSGGYPIAWPNVVYEPQAGVTYLRVSIIPGDTLQASLGSIGKDVTECIYQIDVVTQRGTGRTAITDSIADHFKRGSVLTYNSTKLRVRSVSIGPAINEDAWQFVPVSVSVQTYSEAR